MPMIKKIAVSTLAALTLSALSPALASDYLGNPKSMKFHFSDCRTIKHPENFVEFSSRDEAVEAGYSPAASASRKTKKPPPCANMMSGHVVCGIGSNELYYKEHM